MDKEEKLAALHEITKLTQELYQLEKQLRDGHEAFGKAFKSAVVRQKEIKIVIKEIKDRITQSPPSLLDQAKAARAKREEEEFEAERRYALHYLSGGRPYSHIPPRLRFRANAEFFEAEGFVVQESEFFWTVSIPED